MTAAGFGGGAIVTDLSTLFSDPAQGAAQSMQYRQGTIISFNQITLENVVNVGGQNMVNLPVLGVAEAATYVPGAVVGLMIINSSWAIIGRFVVPNTPAATDAITQLSQAIVSDFIVTQESTSSAAFVDLTTIGPTVVANIKTSGRCLVFTSATISIQPGANFPSAWGGFVSLDVSGANTIAPTAINGSLGFIFGDNALNQSWVQSFTRMIVLSGLNPGLTTFRAKYAVNLGGPPETALFRNRGLAVFSL
jgi:hypothetical protein